MLWDVVSMGCCFNYMNIDMKLSYKFILKFIANIAIYYNLLDGPSILKFIVNTDLSGGPFILKLIANTAIYITTY